MYALAYAIDGLALWGLWNLVWVACAWMARRPLDYTDADYQDYSFGALEGLPLGCSESGE